MKNKSKILICAATVVAVIAISAVAVKSYLFARYDGKNAVRVEIPAFSDKAAVDSIIESSLGGSYGRKAMARKTEKGGIFRNVHCKT